MEGQMRARFNMQIYEEACEWFIECRAGDLGDASRSELDRWLRMSPEHLSAYLEIAAIWSEGPSLDPSNKWDLDALISQAAEDPGNLVTLTRARRSSPIRSAEEAVAATPLGDAASPETTSVGRGQVVVRELNTLERRSASPRRRHVFLIAACVATLTLMAGAAVWLALSRDPVYLTKTGVQRSLALTDGSTIELNSRSKIQVRYSEHERTVELLEGQALFHVAKDVARPFFVRSGEMSVRAVGTKFDVYKKSSGTVVTVVEGRVAVLSGSEEPAPGTNDPAAGAQRPPLPALRSADATGLAGSIILVAGEQGIVTRKTVRKTEHPNVPSATAWTQRKIVFDSTSLTEVAEEFNRYNDRELVIDRSALGNLHISGVFSSTDPASLIRFLRQRPGLRITETAAEIRIEKEIP
jgi:transmembrane sensor